MADILPAVLSGPYRGMDRPMFDRKFQVPENDGKGNDPGETEPITVGGSDPAGMPSRLQPGQMADHEKWFAENARYHREVIKVLRQSLSIPEDSYIHLTGSAIDLAFKLADEQGVQRPEMPENLNADGFRNDRDPGATDIGFIAFGTSGYGQGTNSVSLTFNIKTVGSADLSSLGMSEVVGERDIPALKAELGEVARPDDGPSGILEQLPMAGGQTDRLHRIVMHADDGSDDGGTAGGNGKGKGKGPADPPHHNGGPPPWAGLPHGPIHGSGPDDNSGGSETLLGLVHSTGIFKDRHDIGLELFRKISLAVGS